MNQKKVIRRQSNNVSASRRDWTILMSRAYCRIVDIFNQRVDAQTKEKQLDTNNLKYSELFDKLSMSDLLIYDIPRTDLAVTGKDGKVDVPTVKQFKQAFDRLADRALVTGSPSDDEDWERVNIIGSVKYDKATDCVHVVQHTQIIKHLLLQRDNYTYFNPWMSFKFVKSKYSFSFYQWCCQWRSVGNFSLTVNDIKWRLELDEHRDSDGRLHKERYQEVNKLIKKIIEPAKEELQGLYDSGDCDVCFAYSLDYDKSKTGRHTVTGFEFKIKKRNKSRQLPKPERSISYQNFNDRLITLRETLRYYWDGAIDEQWPARAINELGKIAASNPKLLNEAERYINITINEGRTGKVKNVPGAIRGFFQKKFNIKV